jgi:hypothetical protein
MLATLAGARGNQALRVSRNVGGALKTGSWAVDDAM